MSPSLAISAANGIERKILRREYSGKPVAETIINGFFSVDRKWTVLYWNKAAERLLNVKAVDIVGKNLWEEFADIIPLDFYEVYHKAFLQDIPLHFQEYWGEMDAWFDVITYYSDNSLSVSFKSSFQPDSSYQENPVQRLKALTELYRLVTEITNDCLWEWDLNQKELFWIDGGHKRMFGYQIENALIPQAFWENRLHPDDKIRILARLNKVIEHGPGQTWQVQYRFRNADGNFVDVCDRAHIIYDAESHAIRMVGATQDITEQVLLEKKLDQDRQQAQKEITMAVLAAHEDERLEIGRELHDNVNQILSAAKLYTSLVSHGEGNNIQLLKKSSQFIQMAIDEIRKISKSIGPIRIESMGLFSCIETLIFDLSADSLKIRFTRSNVVEKTLDEKLRLNIFRIIQEHLTNILKHAEATKASINLRIDKNCLILTISDNGKGCDLTVKTKGIGIRNIRSRAVVFNGSVEINSTPGNGFELKVSFPDPFNTADMQNTDDE